MEVTPTDLTYIDPPNILPEKIKNVRTQEKEKFAELQSQLFPMIGKIVEISRRGSYDEFEREVIRLFAFFGLEVSDGELLQKNQESWKYAFKEIKQGQFSDVQFFGKPLSSGEVLYANFNFFPLISGRNEGFVCSPGACSVPRKYQASDEYVTAKDFFAIAEKLFGLIPDERSSETYPQISQSPAERNATGFTYSFVLVMLGKVVQIPANEFSLKIIRFLRSL